MRGNRPKSWYIFVSIIGFTTFGTASIFVRLINMDALAIATWRLIIGGLILFILSYNSRLAEEKVDIAKVILLGSILGFHFIFFVKSVQDTFILNATIIVNTAPILTLVLSAIFKLEKIDFIDVLTVILGVLGVIVIVGSISITSQKIIGDIEAFLAALALSVYAITGRRYLKQKIDAIKLSSVVFTIAGLETLLIGVLLKVSFQPPTLSDVIYLLGLALIPTGIGHTVYLYSLKGLKAHETQILALLEPIVATMLGVLILLEIPSLNSIIGSVLIAVSILLIALKPKIISEEA